MHLQADSRNCEGSCTVAGQRLKVANDSTRSWWFMSFRRSMYGASFLRSVGRIFTRARTHKLPSLFPYAWFPVGAPRNRELPLQPPVASAAPEAAQLATDARCRSRSGNVDVGDHEARARCVREARVPVALRQCWWRSLFASRNAAASSARKCRKTWQVGMLSW